MTRWVILIVVTILIIVAGLAVLVVPAQAPTQHNGNEQPAPASKDDLIEVSFPLPDALIASPLVASGKARGNWYFEASFPVEVRDASGNMIGQGYAQAQGEWMTTEYVPFKTIAITYAPQAKGSKGSIIFRKDNPSGLPEHDNELVVPVTF